MRSRKLCPFANAPFDMLEMLLRSSPMLQAWDASQSSTMFWEKGEMVSKGGN